MFKVRVIPCLDVKDGRVVKGVNFVDLRDAGDPVEAAIAYDAPRAPTSSLFSTSPRPMRTAASCWTWSGAPPKPASCP
ncbi:hypothetical protein ACVWWK_001648 [Bradyrhizobium sp. LB9.1b]